MQLTAMPTLSVAKTPPLRLCEGQMLLVIADSHARLQGSHGQWHLARVTKEVGVSAGSRAIVLAARGPDEPNAKKVEGSQHLLTQNMHLIVFMLKN